MILGQNSNQSNIARHGSVTAKFVLVTPEMATEWLSNNQQNRELKQGHIDDLSRAMTLGRFRLTSQGLGFDRNGVLIDGQHRLNAIVKSGASIFMLVVEGLDPMARAGTDLGISRGPRDLLKLLAGEEESAFVAAAINAIRRGVYRTTAKQAWEDLDAEYQRFREGIEWAKSVEWSKRFGSSPVVGAMVFAYKVTPRVVHAIHDDLESGIILPDQSTTRDLRDYILGTTITGDRARGEMFGKTLAVIWHRHHGRNPKKIYATQAAIEFFARAY